MKRPDFHQDDPKKSDYIKNNPFPKIEKTDEGKHLVVRENKVAYEEIPYVPTMKAQDKSEAENGGRAWYSHPENAYPRVYTESAASKKPYNKHFLTEKPVAPIDPDGRAAVYGKGVYFSKAAASERLSDVNNMGNHVKAVSDAADFISFTPDTSSEDKWLEIYKHESGGSADREFCIKPTTADNTLGDGKKVVIEFDIKMENFEELSEAPYIEPYTTGWTFRIAPLFNIQSGSGTTGARAIPTGTSQNSALLIFAKKNGIFVKAVNKADYIYECDPYSIFNFKLALFNKKYYVYINDYLVATGDSVVNTDTAVSFARGGIFLNAKESVKFAIANIFCGVVDGEDELSGRYLDSIPVRKHNKHILVPSKLSEYKDYEADGLAAEEYALSYGAAKEMMSKIETPDGALTVIPVANKDTIGGIKDGGDISIGNSGVVSLTSTVKQEIVGSVEMPTLTSLGAAASDHTHSEYAASTHDHDSTYAKADHTHSGYAASGHTHTDYAEKGHSHSTEYAKAAHTHEEYASSNHGHGTQYASSSHTHSEYADSGHTHTGYASFSHKHSASEITSGTLDGNILPLPKANTLGGIASGGDITVDTDGKVTISDAVKKDIASQISVDVTAHTHKASEITSGTFSSDILPIVPINKGGTGATTAAAALSALGAAASGHTHSGYAASDHDHDDTYAKASHSHSGYASSSHNHSGTYAPYNHWHDDLYADVNHTHSEYADYSHDHDDVYLKSNDCPKPESFYLGVVTSGSPYLSVESLPKNYVYLLYLSKTVDEETDSRIDFVFITDKPKTGSASVGYKVAQAGAKLYFDTEYIGFSVTANKILKL
jgi:hypothetical protein